MIRVLQFAAVGERLGGRCGYVSSQLRQYSKQASPHVSLYLVLFVNSTPFVASALKTGWEIVLCLRADLPQTRVKTLFFLAPTAGAPILITTLRAREAPYSFYFADTPLHSIWSPRDIRT